MNSTKVIRAPGLHVSCYLSAIFPIRQVVDSFPFNVSEYVCVPSLESSGTLEEFVVSASSLLRIRPID